MTHHPGLQLIPATPDMLRAELQGRAELERCLGVQVPASWPPELHDRQRVAAVLERLQQFPSEQAWWLHYVANREADQERAALVGVSGFKGPPTPEGEVEVWYTVLPDFRRQGFGAEATLLMLAKAFAQPLVTRVAAETLQEQLPAIGVLAKTGFTFAGEGSDEGLVRYEVTRGQYLRQQD